jgi:hypothetical protein
MPDFRVFAVSRFRGLKQSALSLMSRPSTDTRGSFSHCAMFHDLMTALDELANAPGGADVELSPEE